MIHEKPALSNCLAHHGILGMKWGVRRYQNEDGSLTEAGKERYSQGKTSAQLESEASKRHDAKNRGAIDDDALKKKVERLKLELELKDLTEKDLSPGKKYMKEIMTDSSKRILTNAFTGGGLYLAKVFAEGLGDEGSFNFSRKELAEALFNGGPKKK